MNVTPPGYLSSDYNQAENNIQFSVAFLKGLRTIKIIIKSYYFPGLVYRRRGIIRRSGGLTLFQEETQYMLRFSEHVYQNCFFF